MKGKNKEQLRCVPEFDFSGLKRNYEGRESEQLVVVLKRGRYASRSVQIMR